MFENRKGHSFRFFFVGALRRFCLDRLQTVEKEIGRFRLRLRKQSIEGGGLANPLNKLERGIKARALVLLF